MKHYTHEDSIKHGTEQSLILLDVHVHIYSCFNLQSFFDTAYSNFQHQASKNNKGERFLCFIFLTDWSGKNWFQKLRDLTDKDSSNNEIHIQNWSFSKTDEDCSIVASRTDNDKLYIVAGRKVITADNLEVLALTLEQDCIPNGLDIVETVKLIKDKNGIPFIPWAVGKWFGRRGVAVKNLIDTFNSTDVYLCDNGNRPFFWPWPTLFKLAKQKQIKILSGSDPLHFPSEADRAGSFGSWLRATINTNHPASDLKDILRENSLKIYHYGKSEGLLRFFRHQLLMQIFKRKWKREFYK